jgi:2-polyprenyl-6-methoxyphenol hydroxylase-like FAD-dependent oxidoreductase
VSAPFAVVVGAGPAGTSAALGLLRAGVEVLVVDQRTVWRDRVCGGFVNPEGVRHLAWLGLVDEALASGGSWIRESAVSAASGRKGLVRVVRDGTPGLGISRRALEQLLVHAVAGRGGAVRLGCRAVDVQQAGARWRVTARAGHDPPETLECDLVVLADGRFSSAARSHIPRRRHGWFGWNATFEGVPHPPGTLSMHFHAFGYVGVLTFADGSTNVCGLSRLDDAAVRSWEAVWAATLDAQSTLAGLVQGSRRVTEWRGVGPLPFCRTMRQSDGPLLAGDAAAVGDPYMGEGISRALGTGGLLCDALEASGHQFDATRVSHEYVRRWRRRYTPRLLAGSLIRPLQRRPAVFEHVLEHALAHPAVAQLLLRVCHPVAGLPGTVPVTPGQTGGA